MNRVPRLRILAEVKIRSCKDFGDIVFNMVEIELLAKTERDSREDFADGYDFEEAFCRPFLPSGKQPPTRRSNTVSAPNIKLQG